MQEPFNPIFTVCVCVSRRAQEARRSVRRCTHTRRVQSLAHSLPQDSARAPLPSFRLSAECVRGYSRASPSALSCAVACAPNTVHAHIHASCVSIKAHLLQSAHAAIHIPLLSMTSTVLHNIVCTALLPRRTEHKPHARIS